MLLWGAQGMPTRVLVVDDSPTIRKVVSAVLERHGFAAAQAADGQAALEQLVEAADARSDSDGMPRIDLVLVDFVMPRMNGFQFCRAVRENGRLRTTPIVLMSAKSDRIRDHFVKQTGAIDAITKPFDAQALLAVIENAIRRAEEWRQRDEVLTSIQDEALPVEAPGSSGEDSSRGALDGDMAVIPIGAVLQLLQIESKTGVLLVERRQDRGDDLASAMGSSTSCRPAAPGRNSGLGGTSSRPVSPRPPTSSASCATTRRRRCLRRSSGAEKSDDSQGGEPDRGPATARRSPRRLGARHARPATRGARPAIE